MNSEDVTYLLRRAAEEKDQASKASHAHARRAHQMLADAYEAKLPQKRTGQLGVLSAEPLKTLVYEMIG